MNYGISLRNISMSINETIKIIDNGGIDQSLDTMFDKQKLDNSLFKENLKQSANNSIIEKSKIYDTSLTSIKENLGQIRELVIRSQTDAVPDKENILKEVESLKESIMDTLNTKDSEGYIFSGTKTKTKPFEGNLFNGNYQSMQVLVDSNLRKEKIISPDFLNTNGKNILEHLSDIINDITDINNLDKIDIIEKSISMTQSKLGSNVSQAERRLSISTERYLELNNTFDKNNNKFEEMTLKLNNLSVQYQSLALSLKKTENLSLVYYI